MARLTQVGTLLCALSSVAVAGAPSAQKWTERSIYQIMTDRFARPKGAADDTCDSYKYCGGSWAGIIDKLDYIQDLGFTALQISPVVENIPDNTEYGEAYHGYWPRNLYALNSHFGTADDLQKLSKELHKRGMYLMVDVVINDMAQAINGSMTDDPSPKIDYSRLVPFNDEKYYHPFCSITDWNDPDIIKQCWLGEEVVALPDLKTDHSDVVSTIQTWVKGLVGNYSIDGLRIDATKHMDDAYLTNFTQAAGVFTMGEVYSGDPNTVCRYKQFVSDLLNYPVYYPMIDAFTAGNMPGLAENVRKAPDDCGALATFVENHDLPRFASLDNDTTLAKNAMAFNILSDGIPIVYQGQEQHMKGDYAPYNRDPLWTTGYSTDGSLYKLTSTLNKLRNHAIRNDKNYISNTSQELYVDGSTYATRKGSEGTQIVSVFSNQGARGGPYQLKVAGAYSPGTEVMEMLNCTKLNATDAGDINVDMNAGEPRVFFPVKKLDGSGLCGFAKRKASGCTPSGNTTSTQKNNTKEEDVPESTGHHVSVSFSTFVLGVVVGAAGWLL
ncbi:putative alpha-amylase [Aspergillus ellipticus CBS 707.79]|uniref:Alpha-amylase n=1 Tax=Aspergillus ellipticus CBS 707.79 TaxID=1448320 RepID=A0A319ET73_9EURO|nr:putative alpha-amylase [Aspergillus ellipticus CBS 707.79]